MLSKRNRTQRVHTVTPFTWGSGGQTCIQNENGVEGLQLERQEQDGPPSSGSQPF